MEEALGETAKVYKINGQFWYHKAYPMAFFKPFGYSASPSVLMICAFWIFAVLLVCLHGLKYWWTHKQQAKRNAKAAITANSETGTDGDVHRDEENDADINITSFVVESSSEKNKAINNNNEQEMRLETV